jgi:hypothetical protein
MTEVPLVYERMAVDSAGRRLDDYVYDLDSGSYLSIYEAAERNLTAKARRQRWHSWRGKGGLPTHTYTPPTLPHPQVQRLHRALPPGVAYALPPPPAPRPHWLVMRAPTHVRGADPHKAAVGHDRCGIGPGPMPLRGVGGHHRRLPRVHVQGGGRGDACQRAVRADEASQRVGTELFRRIADGEARPGACRQGRACVCGWEYGPPLLVGLLDGRTPGRKRVCWPLPPAPSPWCAPLPPRLCGVPPAPCCPLPPPRLCAARKRARGPLPGTGVCVPPAVRPECSHEPVHA